MAVHGTIYVHFIPILVWKGETQQVAANMIGGMVTKELQKNLDGFKELVEKST